ncbi:UDP-Glycosyltransferase/glycogen phosphorylase [Trametes elegans]|nr:UDP-Glycosyltransferase/glycogen phosphorylase [Trametes elegans]
MGHLSLECARVPILVLLHRLAMHPSSTPTKHLFACPAHMWGHVRPLAVLAGRILKMRPVAVTFFIPSKYLDGARAELARELASTDEHVAERLRLVPIEQGEDALDTALFERNVLAVWGRLFGGATVPCSSLDGTQRTLDFASAGPLSAALIDILLVECFHTLRERRTTLARPCRIYTWLPVAVNAVLARCRFDAVPLAEAVAASTGVSFDEAARQLVLVPTGQVVHCPGFPDMYDYEYLPQDFPIPADQCGRIYIRLGRVLQQTDGVLTFDSAAYHPEAVAAAREWLAETSRKIYYTGPLVPSGSAVDGVALTEEGKAVLAFLDRQLAERGERSVIYISFGSLFWPTNPEKVHLVLQVLAEGNIPFILTQSSAYIALLEETKTMLNRYNDAAIVDWAPQQAVLEHPVCHIASVLRPSAPHQPLQATGWCLTHGGHNTVLECILAGVPMILWPIFTDQPSNAIHLTEHLGVAYELLEVRHGTAARAPVLRTGRAPVGTPAALRAELRGVLADAFGRGGAGRRAKLARVRGELDGAWTGPGGTARGEVEAFLDAW